MKNKQLSQSVEISCNELIEYQRKVYKLDIKINEKMIKSFRNSKEFEIILNIKKFNENEKIIEYMTLFSDLEVMPLFDIWALDKSVAFFDFQVLQHLKASQTSNIINV
jgi:hypothetical protein